MGRPPLPAGRGRDRSGRVRRGGGRSIAVLQIVLSLWDDYPIALRYTCEYLGEENLSLVAKALFLSNGYDEPHQLS
ncbi:hypothetical protein [Streptomyces sp. NPDC059072]|uniref:hypothetical protein n=1 Tax=Streptomyces sp. NPDC059072 TaxID=3346715 RepID=UPI0036879E2D